MNAGHLTTSESLNLGRSQHIALYILNLQIILQAVDTLKFALSATIDENIFISTAKNKLWNASGSASTHYVATLFFHKATAAF